MKGFVYIFTNPALKVIKIGKTSRTPDERAKELFTTALPFPFEVYAYLETERFNEVEQYVHNTLDLITNTRCNESREFFNIEPEVAKKILENLLPLIDDAKLVTKSSALEKQKENDRKPKERKPIFKFSSIGLKPGDTIIFTCTGKEFVICDDRHISVNGSPVSLSRYMHDWYLKTKGKDLPFQGPRYFSKNGIKLSDL